MAKTSIVPSIQDMFLPTLQALHTAEDALTREDLCAAVAEIMKLTPAQLAEPMPNDRRTRFEWRMYFVTTHLKKAGVIMATAPKTFKITPAGLHLIHECLPSITSKVLRDRYPSYVAFLNGNRGKKTVESAPEDIAAEAVSEGDKTSKSRCLRG
jgi:restriction endonuclease Mrr